MQGRRRTGGGPRVGLMARPGALSPKVASLNPLCTLGPTVLRENLFLGPFHPHQLKGLSNGLQFCPSNGNISPCQRVARPGPGFMQGLQTLFGTTPQPASAHLAGASWQGLQCGHSLVTSRVLNKIVAVSFVVGPLD